MKMLKIAIFALLLASRLQAQADFVQISPLVTTQKIHIEQTAYIGESSQKVEIRIFDLFGVLLYRHLQPLDLNGKMQPLDIDLSKFAAAAYVVELRQGKRFYKTQIIKRHH